MILLVLSSNINSELPRHISYWEALAYLWVIPTGINENRLYKSPCSRLRTSSHNHHQGFKEGDTLFLSLPITAQFISWSSLYHPALCYPTSDQSIVQLPRLQEQSARFPLGRTAPAWTQRANQDCAGSTLGSQIPAGRRSKKLLESPRKPLWGQGFLVPHGSGWLSNACHILWPLGSYTATAHLSPIKPLKDDSYQTEPHLLLVHYHTSNL